MNNWKAILFAGIFMIGSSSTIPAVKSAYPTLPLCLPAPYLEAQENCVSAGPSAVLTLQAEMAVSAVTLVDRFISIGEEYGQFEFNYVKINPDQERLLYPSMQNAINREGHISSFPGGYSYATYQERAYGADGKTYYYLNNGYWLRGGATQGHVDPINFRGVQIADTQPARKFGWVLQNVETRTKPGYYRNFGSGHTLARHEMVEVYDEIQINNYTYYLIAPDEWIVQTALGLIYPSAVPPTGVVSGRWIEINLFEQTTAVYQDGRLIFATLTTSGSDRYFTRPGLFKITEKLALTNMQGGVEPDGSDRYYLQDVPWTMYFDERRAFHGEYWHDHLGYKSSHGCANLSFADAEWLYSWANLGDWVYVWDPSGETPVKEQLFTQYLDS
ncbi:MAG: L,D-transpeptidase [Chloroflexota bacterium]